MNYDVSKDNLSVRNLEFEGCQEIAVDIDFSLPDYCPDIQRILKCQVCPQIAARNISGDRLNVEGTADIRLIYLDSDNMRIRCCENSAPFSTSIDIRCTPENAIALTSARTEYINCRAVSPRKIDIHGAFSMCAKIYGKNSTNISCCVSGKDIQQKIENTMGSNLVGMGQQQFSINEMLEMGENTPAPEMIIRSDVSIILIDYKTTANKVVIKGEAILKILYMDDISSGNLQTMQYSIPISQIIDVPGADENCQYIMMGEILSHDEQIHSENEESRGRISTEIRIAATIMAYTEKELGVVSDIYSTDNNLKTESEPLKLSKLKDIIKENFSHKSSVNLPETNTSKIVDVWSDACSAKAVPEGDKLIFKGKMNLCILALDVDNIPFYIERIVEFEHARELGETSQDVMAEITLVPTSIGYSISKDSKVDVKIDFNVSGAVYLNQKHDMITAVEADESRPADKDRNASLTIYFASESEPLWDIARKYYTSVNAIKQENDISGDIAPKNGMLLIPMR